MKSCHAAALALVGWYLMLPRVSYLPESVEKGHSAWVTRCLDSKNNPDFSTWETVASYDTAVECEKELSILDPAGGSPTPNGLEGAKRDPKGLATAARAAVRQAKCIASDDPRLKEK
jgi:hypothetical protein